MSNFDSAIKVVLRHEGGYVDNPADSGGATNYGISLRFLQTVPELGDINHDGKVDKQDIRSMKWEDAKFIYQVQWWDLYSYKRIVDQTIATKVLDFSINMGAKQAHKLVQRAVNRVSNYKLVDDGVLGKLSFDAINSFTTVEAQQKLITAISDEAWDYYQAIIRKNPSYSVFRNGWRNRAYSISKARSIT